MLILPSYFLIGLNMSEGGSRLLYFILMNVVFIALFDSMSEFFASVCATLQTVGLEY